MKVQLHPLPNNLNRVILDHVLTGPYLLEFLLNVKALKNPQRRYFQVKGFYHKDKKDNENPYTDKTAALYWVSPLDFAKQRHQTASLKFLSQDDRYVAMNT